MYALDLTFRPAPGLDSDELLDRAQQFVGDALRSGQCCDPWPLFLRRGDAVTCRVAVPAEDALDRRHDSRAVAAHRAHLLLDVRPAGPIEETDEACVCDPPPSLVLFVTFLSTESPLRCGDCGDVVPMYTVPSPRGGGDHEALTFWARQYRDLDRLYMASGVGEGFAYAELSRRDSRFMIRTLELCAAYERAVGRAVYAYVDRVHGAAMAACPECGRPWTEDRGAGAWRYRCEPCRILMPEATDTGPPPAP